MYQPEVSWFSKIVTKKLELKIEFTNTDIQ